MSDLDLYPLYYGIRVLESPPTKAEVKEMFRQYLERLPTVLSTIKKKLLEDGIDVDSLEPPSRMREVGKWLVSKGKLERYSDEEIAAQFKAYSMFPDPEEYVEYTRLDAHSTSLCYYIGDLFMVALTEYVPGAKLTPCLSNTLYYGVPVVKRDGVMVESAGPSVCKIFLSQWLQNSTPVELDYIFSLQAQDLKDDAPPRKTKHAN